MANVNPGIATKDGAIPASAHTHDTDAAHGHRHAHPAGHNHEASHAAAVAIPRAYKHSMFLASAIERLVIAVLLIGLIWLGIFWSIA